MKIPETGKLFQKKGRLGFETASSKLHYIEILLAKKLISFLLKQNQTHPSIPDQYQW
jgi:hypothetical protein